MTIKKTIFLLALLSLFSFSSYFLGKSFVFSRPHYLVETPDRKLVTINRKGPSLIQKLYYNLVGHRFAGTDGICAPPGCAPPGGFDAPDRENVSFLLNDEQITSLLNAYSPASSLFGNTKVRFEKGKVFAGTNSFVPGLFGRLSLSGRVALNHFYVDDAYLGDSKLSAEKVNSIEANGAGLLDKEFQKYGIFVKALELSDDKLLFEANIPKGSIRLEGERIVLELKEQPLRGY